MAGDPVARALDTASWTQLRIGASLVWHIRQMSPAATGVSNTTVPDSSLTWTVPGCGISNVLSCEPYSSAACAINPTFGTVPIVVGSNAPWARQSSMTTW